MHGRQHHAKHHERPAGRRSRMPAHLDTAPAAASAYPSGALAPSTNKKEGNQWK